MSKGRYTSRRRRNTLKPLLIAMAVVLLIGCVAGGTLAWLMDTTDEVVNTFTVGDIDIELNETKGHINPETNDREFKMVPGNTIDKDPKVTVKADSEACWLFVKIEETANLGTFISYTVDSDWTALGTAYPGVYYYNGTDLNALLTADKTFSVLANDKVTVKDTVTKADMTGLKAEGAVLPALTFKAYAVQKANIESAQKAWETINTPPAA